MMLSYTRNVAGVQVPTAVAWFGGVCYPIPMGSRGKKGRRKKSTSTRDGKPVAQPELARPTAGPAPRWLRVVLPVLVALAAFITFLPALDAGFVNWDDDKLFLAEKNKLCRGLGWQNIKWMFETTTMGHWQPLSWVTFGVDHTLHGLEPRGCHRTSMLLHSGCAVAFYFLAVRLLTLGVGGRNPSSGAALRIAAALAALFFAVHPLRVESVAWVTERRDLLSGLFFIITITLYVKSRTVRRRRALWYVAAIAVFCLSVMSEAWGMTIPAILIVLDFHPLRRLGGRISSWFSRAAMWVWLEKVPFVVIAGMTALKAITAQQGQLKTAKSLAEHPLVPRLVQMGYGAAFYVSKTLLPTDLIPLYELSQVQKNPAELRFVVSVIAVVIVAIVLVLLRRRWPAGLALAVCYLAIYSPVSGLAQSGPQLVKDSYSYLCCLSWAVLFGGVLLWCHRRWGLRCFIGAACAGVVWCATLGTLSRYQTGIWHDSKALWTHTLRIDDNCAMGHMNLAVLLKQEGKVPQAAEHYRRSLDIDPDNPDAHFNYANSLKALKQYDSAVEHYERAIELQKTVKRRRTHRQAHVNLGNTHLLLGNLDRAIEHHRIAAPRARQAELYNLLAVNLRKKAAQLQGDPRRALENEAEGNFRRAIKAKPQYPTALCNLARLLIERGRCDEAIEYLDKALEIRPTANEPRKLLARAQTECRR